MMSKDEQFKDIMDNFDFEKVYQLMTFMNWHWINENGPSSVPTLYQIRGMAHDLLTEVIYNDNNMNASCGGLCVIREAPEHFKLTFEAVDWSSVYSDLDHPDNAF